MTDDIDQRILAGTEALAARITAAPTIASYLSIIDLPRVQQQIQYLRRHRPDLWRSLLKPSIDTAWKRVREAAR